MLLLLVYDWKILGGSYNRTGMSYLRVHYANRFIGVIMDAFWFEKRFKRFASALSTTLCSDF